VRNEDLYLAREFRARMGSGAEPAGIAKLAKVMREFSRVCDRSSRALKCTMGL
jgi:hypothetical protein